MFPESTTSSETIQTFVYLFRKIVKAQVEPILDKEGRGELTHFYHSTIRIIWQHTSQLLRESS